MKSKNKNLSTEERKRLSELIAEEEAVEYKDGDLEREEVALSERISKLVANDSKHDDGVAPSENMEENLKKIKERMASSSDREAKVLTLNWKKDWRMMGSAMAAAAALLLFVHLGPQVFSPSEPDYTGYKGEDQSLANCEYQYWNPDFGSLDGNGLEYSAKRGTTVNLRFKCDYRGYVHIKLIRSNGEQQILNMSANELSLLSSEDGKIQEILLDQDTQVYMYYTSTLIPQNTKLTGSSMERLNGQKVLWQDSSIINTSGGQ